MDVANDLAEAERQSLALACMLLLAHPRVPPRHDAAGRRVCVTCLRPLSQQRLAAVPHAVACTACEAAEEHRHRSKRAWAV